eukprot:CAMPEP_0118874164 /NCGR_PEP_ID=MMETSP1163-20130328/15717_1 /TAXON_ID=124430 /ORGANISM="Phaeomonas parva, Strain CCMP2877" /LENGTH=382 /DNA_ID=CAMNT_0006809525 /DNA_START=72 /DNA_END=1220 /DNA_ORIENTATION=-
MDGLCQRSLAQWLADRAGLAAPEAKSYATDLVRDGWTSADIMLSELRAEAGDAEAFLGLIARRGDRRRVLLALEAHEAALAAKKEGEEQDQDGVAEGAAAEALEEKQAKLAEWLRRHGITAAVAEESAAKLAADGYDDLKVIRWEVRATGEGFLGGYLERRGDARRVAEAIAAIERVEALLEAKEEGESKASAPQAQPLSIEVSVNGQPMRFSSEAVKEATPAPAEGLENAPPAEVARAADAMRILRSAARTDIPAITIDGMTVPETLAFLREVESLAASAMQVRLRLGRAGMCGSVAAAMERFPSSRDVQCEGCRAASSLMVNAPRHVEAFEDLGFREKVKGIQASYNIDGHMQLSAQDALAKLDRRKPVSRNVDTNTLPW